MSVERIVTEDGVTIDLVANSCDSLEWDSDLEKSLASHFGRFILREICRGMFVNSTVTDGKFMAGFQSLEGDMDANYDPTLLIDWWISGQSNATTVVVDGESKAEARVVLGWLDGQARRIREAFGL